MVNIKACRKATNNSKTLINKANGTEMKATPALDNIKIKPIKLNIIMWPAVMLANRRIIKAIGFINKPTNSMGANKIRTGTGTPGIQKICFQ